MREWEGGSEGKGMRSMGEGGSKENERRREHGKGSGMVEGGRKERDGL